MSLAIKMALSGIPFLFLAIEPSDVINAADSFMKYGELGLCFALVAYLIYSNYNLVASLEKLIAEKSRQEERVTNAIQTFCAVCRERPCLVGANAFKVDNPDGIVNATGDNQ